MESRTPYTKNVSEVPEETAAPANTPRLNGSLQMNITLGIYTEFSASGWQAFLNGLLAREAEFQQKMIAMYKAMQGPRNSTQT